MSNPAASFDTLFLRGGTVQRDLRHKVKLYDEI